jgi:hypothetical protein
MLNVLVAFNERSAIYSETGIKPTNNLCARHADLLTAESQGAQSYDYL